MRRWCRLRYPLFRAGLDDRHEHSCSDEREYWETTGDLPRIHPSPHSEAVRLHGVYAGRWLCRRAAYLVCSSAWLRVQSFPPSVASSLPNLGPLTKQPIASVRLLLEGIQKIVVFHLHPGCAWECSFHQRFVRFLLALLLPQPRLARTQDGLRPAGNLELTEDIGDMVAHRFQREIQLIRNLLVALTLRHQR